MPHLSGLNLVGCSGIKSFQHRHWHSLVELVLFNSCLTEVPACLNTSVPSLERIHIEDDCGYLSKWEDQYKSSWEMIDEQFPSEASDALASMVKLEQISGNTIVKVLAKVGVLNGWHLASLNDNPVGFTCSKLSLPGMRLLMRDEPLT